MIALILAAGVGSRLTNSALPKPMTPLHNGKSLMEMQIENLQKREEIDEIAAVVGYRQEMIREAFPYLTFIENPLYSGENTAKSLLRAIDNVDDDLLWLNGDVLFYPQLLDNLLAATHSSMVVNIAAVGEEEVKYRTDDSNAIVAVSKEIERGEGEALGINLLKKNDLHIFTECLSLCSNNDYFEKAIQLSIDRGIRFDAIVVPTNWCVEVDFNEDITRANELLALWKDNEPKI